MMSIKIIRVHSLIWELKQLLETATKLDRHHSHLSVEARTELRLSLTDAYLENVRMRLTMLLETLNQEPSREWEEIKQLLQEISQQKGPA